MKYIVTIVLAIFIESCTFQKDTKTLNKLAFDEDWESLQQYQEPEWFKDAKFGIFVHWGVYAVPANSSEWYPRFMYMDSVVWNPDGEVSKIGATQANKYHLKKYGPLNKFGYKDFIPLFKGEKFNAEEWVDIFKNSGAKYIIPVADHHDGFAMYNSKYTKWNAVNMGPKKDVLGELMQEARKKNIKIGASTHFAFNWNYYTYKEGYDTMNPKFSALYSRPHSHYAPADQEFLSHWWDRTKDIIDHYQPDLLYFDFYSDKEEFTSYHPKIASYLYNKGIEWKKDVVLQSKNFKKITFPEGTHILDIERGKMADISPRSWQTCTSIGENSWGYIKNWKSKNANTLIDDLVDIVSKNGNMLLNVGPKADGSIPQDQIAVLNEIGEWLTINSKAIYGSRPWEVYGEGPTEVATGHHTEKTNTVLTSKDFRFTTNNGRLYTIAMDWPSSGELNVKILKKGSEYITSEIKGIKLLGTNTLIEWSQNENELNMILPDTKPCKHAFVFEITFKEDKQLM